MSRPIVYASDFSPASRAAFAKAVDLARRERAELLVAHVVMTVPMPIIGNGHALPPPTWEELMRIHRRASQKQLDALVRRAKAMGTRARGLLLDGAPPDAILRAAKGHHARMVVLGTHGRRGVARFVLGSVAGRVVARARCPVLTVRGH